jgi:hypothetical protein
MATTLSGQVTVTTAGTAVQGTDAAGNIFALKAHPDNTDAVWVGNVSGDVTSSNGFPLEPGETLMVQVANLNELWFDADVNGERICWIKCN